MRESAGAEALVVVDFAAAAQSIVREALDAGVYDRFVFADAAKRLSLIEAIGAERLGGMYGTAGAPGPRQPRPAPRGMRRSSRCTVLCRRPPTSRRRTTRRWRSCWRPRQQGASTAPPSAINSRAIAGPPGQAVQARPSGVAEALRLLRAGEEIDYEGAASTLDWDANGDLRRGHIGVWRFTADGGIEDVEVVAVEP